MISDEYTVILVYSTSHALQVEKVLGEAKIACKLIPVPRYLSSDCGVCVVIAGADKDPALQVLEKARMEIQGLRDI